MLYFKVSLHRGKWWFMFWEHSLPWFHLNSFHFRSSLMTLNCRGNGSKLSCTWVCDAYCALPQCKLQQWMLNVRKIATSKPSVCKRRRKKQGKLPLLLSFPLMGLRRMIVPSDPLGILKNEDCSFSIAWQQPLPPHSRRNKGLSEASLVSV